MSDTESLLKRAYEIIDNQIKRDIEAHLHVLAEVNDALLPCEVLKKYFRLAISVYHERNDDESSFKKPDIQDMPKLEDTEDNKKYFDMSYDELTDAYKVCTEELDELTNTYKVCTEELDELTDAYKVCTKELDELTDAYKVCSEELTELHDKRHEVLALCHNFSKKESSIEVLTINPVEELIDLIREILE